MKLGVFIRAKETGPLEVTYYRADGSSVLFRDGTRTWRNQNPGNIGAGKLADKFGAIGRAGGFAIFPDRQIGRRAIFRLLKTPKYQVESIARAIAIYAPAEDKNDTERYKKLVRDFTGLDLQRKMSSLSDDELEKLVGAIERVEGWEPGKVIESREVEKNKISAVRKNKKGTIMRYYVAAFGWLTKARAIVLTSQGEIDAVVATSRNGNMYLRSRPDQTPFNNLEELG